MFHNSYLCDAKPKAFINMKSKYSIVCIKKNKADKDGYLYFRAKGKENRTKLSIGLKVDFNQFKKHWNEKEQCFKSGMTNYKLFNEQINESAEKIKAVDGDIKVIAKSDKSFILYWEQKIENETNHGTRQKNTTIINKFKKYLVSLKKSDLKYSELTPSFLDGLHYYLTTTADPKTLAPNQVTHYLKVVKSIVNQKIKEEPRLFIVNPFVSMKLKHNVDDIKRTILKEEDLQLLINSEINNEKINLHRSMFLFQIFAAGMRVSDLMFLRWNMFKGDRFDGKLELVDRIEYKMFKTGKEASIPLSINLCSILIKFVAEQKYIDEVLNTNTLNTPDYFNSGGDRNLTVKQLEDEINTFIKKEYGDEKYKGFVFGSKHKETIMAAIDELERRNRLIEIHLVRYTGYAIPEYINTNKCNNNFVFPYLSNELFANIGEDNDFDRINETQYNKLKNAEILFDRHLKKVAETLGIDSKGFSSHAGRHTFTQLLMDSDTPTHIITSALNHSSVKVTESYLRHKFNPIKNDAVINRIGDDKKHRIK